MPVLIILAVLWAVVLVPPLLRSRSQRTADSIVDFNYKLDVLGQTNGNRRDFDVARRTGSRSRSRSGRSAGLAAGLAPVAGSPTARRSARRSAAATCCRCCAGGLVHAPARVLAHSSLAWALQILVDVVAVAYVALWAWARSVQAERADKVRYMPELRVPELALRRSASS